MTTNAEFDPKDANFVTPGSEPQPWKDDEDEIPSFEGMVFSSYVDPADLTGGAWESAPPIPEMPLTIWEEPPLTEAEILKVIAASHPNAVPSATDGDAAEENEPEENEARHERAEEGADPDWIESTAPIADNLPAVARETQNGSRRGLYGNLADSSWLTLERPRPVEALPGAEFVAQTPFYTKNMEDLRHVEELSAVGQASEPQGDPLELASTAPNGMQEQPQAELPAEESRFGAVETLKDSGSKPLTQVEPTSRETAPEAVDRPLFKSWYMPEEKAPDSTRIPHFGHVVILALLAFAGMVGAILLMRGAVNLNLFGISTVQQASTDIHYTIGFMASLYLLTFGLAVLLFPFIWHKSLFAGLQWNFASARRRIWILLGAAVLCFALAMVDEVVLPGPANAPIDKLFDSRAAAWLLFAFGVTFAPFFEEIAFRGFLLPALCTAFDWYGEKLTGTAPPPLDPGDYPHWSITAMVLGSIVTSIPFALMHAEQTAWSLGPFLLLVAVSLVLSWARLASRSLAASMVVHASYNLLLFSLMLLGTGGFRHLDKM